MDLHPSTHPPARPWGSKMRFVKMYGREVFISKTAPWKGSPGKIFKGWKNICKMDVKKTKCKKYLEQSRLNRGEPKFKDIYGHMHFNNMNIPLHQCPQLTKFTSNSIVTRQQGPLLEFPKYNLTIYNRTKWYTGTLVAFAAAELLKPVGIIDCIEFHVCLTNKKIQKIHLQETPQVRRFLFATAVYTQFYRCGKDKMATKTCPNYIWVIIPNILHITTKHCIAIFGKVRTHYVLHTSSNYSKHELPKIRNLHLQILNGNSHWKCERWKPTNVQASPQKKQQTPWKINMFHP